MSSTDRMLPLVLLGITVVVLVVSGIEALGDRFLLMLGSATEHRIQPKPQECGDHGENDDF